jgi:TRAP-type C4-dicarboxylate transport system substrate-binding protein
MTKKKRRGNMKNAFLSFLTVVLVLVSYTAWAQTPAKPLELKFSSWSPPTSIVAKVDQKMCDMIMEKSQGRIKIATYFGESLLKMPEAFRGVQSGVTDIAYWVVGTMGSPEKLATLMRMPFTGIRTMEMGTAITEKLFRNSPELMAEYKGLEVLGFRMMALYSAHTVKKPVHIPADMQGMKIIATAGWAEYAKLINAAPVSMGIGDYYQSLERGLVEAQWAHFPVCYIFKLLDVHKHHTVLNASSIPDCYLINKDVWNKLTPDLQKMIRDAVEWRTVTITKEDYGEEERAIEYAKKRGNTFYYPTQDEMKLWYDSANPLHENWIARYEKEGLPARMVHERFMQLINDYKK